MANNLTGEKIANWQITCAAVEPELGTLPELVVHHEQLTDFIDEGTRLQVKQKGLRAELQATNRRRREVAEDGEQLRLRMAAALQAKLGFRNEMLISFGVKPRRTSSRLRKPEEDPPEAPAPPQAQSDSQ